MRNLRKKADSDICLFADEEKGGRLDQQVAKPPVLLHRNHLAGRLLWIGNAGSFVFFFFLEECECNQTCLIWQEEEKQSNCGEEDDEKQSLERLPCCHVLLQSLLEFRLLWILQDISEKLNEEQEVEVESSRNYLLWNIKKTLKINKNQTPGERKMMKVKIWNCICIKAVTFKFFKKVLIPQQVFACFCMIDESIKVDWAQFWPCDRFKK